MLGITLIFAGKLFHSPDSGASAGVKRRNSTLPGYGVREAWVTVTLLSSALTTPRLKSKPKKIAEQKLSPAAELQQTGCGGTFNETEKSFAVPRVGFKCKPCVSVTELRRDCL